MNKSLGMYIAGMLTRAIEIGVSGFEGIAGHCGSAFIALRATSSCPSRYLCIQ
ncbi:hypothetical protein [Alicyclobacillus suci]|uniref:hypothetical protein n=1 Tax=Alicyclobacillus suci TaxID=2816080 RepID=UPI0016622B07|nr:hypothetical protein [Alicyclobacillus suci]